MTKKKKNRSNTIICRNDASNVNELIDGYVIKRYDSGDKYEGYVNDSGQRNGKGKYVWRTGDVYEGDWLDGKFHGTGCLTLKTGDIFKGSFLFGRMHGFGIKKNGKDGSIIEGMYALGEPNGFCKKVYHNGDVYNGFLQAAKNTGYGEYKWADGSEYIGHWIEDNMDGNGIKTISRDAVRMQQEQGLLEIVNLYEGSFKLNLFEGFGTASYVNGSKYIGHWKDGKRNGFGRLMLMENYSYHGNFQNDRFHGRGTIASNIEEEQEPTPMIGNLVKIENYIQTYGGHFVGDFYYGQPSGFGILTMVNGKTVKGHFLNGCFIKNFDD